MSEETSNPTDDDDDLGLREAVTTVIDDNVGEAGYRCVHIPPGDTSEEVYRLATFAKYPPNSTVKVWDLATAGCYYTGYKDRTRCFGCGIGTENWQIEDSVFDKKWHKEDCEMVTGHASRNIPIPTPNFYSLKRTFLSSLENTRKPDQVTERKGKEAVKEESKERNGEIANTNEERKLAERLYNRASTKEKDSPKGSIMDKLCKNCERNRANAVTLPCGHIDLCDDCAAESGICKFRI
uniref:death-associated inhibitor of apoptosis 1-like n=1 Tax=Styela clava TaxID=7725 RepID=UPI00193AA626|nr:death-associated inhibitor of apoptosis 1-like [Styela clava]